MIPYQPGYPDSVYYAAAAGFPQIHIKINPKIFSSTSAIAVAKDIFASFNALGIGLTGIWLEVFNENSFWEVSQQANVNISMNILTNFENYFSEIGISPYIGVQTTINNWRFVMGSSTSAASNGFFYWSGIGDSMSDCENLNFAGWTQCLVNGISAAPELNGVDYNLNLFYGQYFN